MTERDEEYRCEVCYGAQSFYETHRPGLCRKCWVRECCSKVVCNIEKVENIMKYGPIPNE